MIVEIISVCLLPIALYIMIKCLYTVIQDALLMERDMAAPDTETLASQLGDWLSAQPHVSYDTTALGEVFGVSNRAINGSMAALMRRGLVAYDIIDNIKYYHCRED